MPDALTEQFHRLCSLPPDQRLGILEDLEQSDPDLVVRLKSLLAAHDRADGFLESLNRQATSQLLKDDEHRAMPAQAGPFRLLHEIGRGGLGVVYLAKRSGDDFEQKVAIKLVKHGMDSEAILRRFHAERRILATLEHSNIARLIDGGLLDDGRPWFAMEYIEGEKITAWSGRKKLSIRERLQLFGQVCDAVQYAHSRLIIHRDLKPDNILVTDKGVIKLLDFGIAKLLADGEEALTELTMAGSRAMTPEYAAPEQIRGEPVSVETDVHALGVVLYQMLTGRHPFSDECDTRAELSEAVCTTLPDPPSVAIRRAGPIDRGESSARRLKGDLDAIVLTALAKSPDQRYRSAEALAEDIRRHLTHVPIRARHRTLTYQAGRFVSRHRLGLAATGSVMLALVVGLSAALWQAGKAQKQAEAAVQSRDFVVSLLRETNPARSDEGVELRAVDLLRQAAERVASAEDVSGDLRARLQSVLAEALLDLGRPNDALPLAEQALVGLLNEYGANSPEAADGLYALARTHAHLGQSSDAAHYAREGALVMEERDQTGTLLYVRLLGIEARASSLQGQYETALALRQRILTERELIVGEDDPRMASAHYNLGTAHYYLNNFTAAERQYHRAGQLLRMQADEMHPRMADIHHGIGAALMGQGRLDEAEAELAKARAIAELKVGPESTMASKIASNMGVLFRLQGRLEDAESILRQAANALERVDSGQTEATSRSWLALVLLARGKYPEAFEQATAARNRLEAIGNESSPHYDVTRCAQALALARTGDIERALALAQSVAGQWLDEDGTFNHVRAEAKELHANLMADLGEAAVATKWWDRSRREFAQALGPDHARTLAVGTVYSDRRFTAAQTRYDELHE